jgi:hypothetical protein
MIGSVTTLFASGSRISPIGSPPSAHDLCLFEQAPPHQDDAAVALAQVLLGAIGDRPLPDPGHEVLVHDVAVDPAAGLLVADGAIPVGESCPG